MKILSLFCPMSQPVNVNRGSCTFLLAVSLSLLLGACASGTRAPVQERSSARPGSAAAVTVAPGYYQVKKGDTLYRIALESGQSYRDIAQWNNLPNPSQIEVGQILRVIPPGADSSAATGTSAIGAGAVSTAVVTAPIQSTTVQARPIDEKPATPPQPLVNTQSASSTTVPAATTANAAAPVFIWPTNGAVIGRFDGSSNKGIDISGKIGDGVSAVAAGKVIFAGNSLRGYGNLIIIKHDNTFITAYAHNSTLLAKDNDEVKQGQKIAEMGNTEADRVKLHFEIRRNGQPVDPLTYLPAR